MARRLMQGPEKRTHPVVWCVAVVCTVIAVAVILTGLVVFVAYLIIQPRVPVVSVAGARLDRIQNDMAGVLEVHIRLVLRAENDNVRAHASFSDTEFDLGFQGIPIVTLKASAFDVPKNDTLDLHYTVVSNFIPLNPSQAEDVGLAVKEDQITFELKGHSRARWRVGLIGSVKFWCNLNCRLNFHPMNGSFIHSKPCTSRAK